MKACIFGAYTLLALVLPSLSCIAQSSTAVSDSSLLLATDRLLADSLLKDSVFISEDLVVLGDLSGAFTHNSNWRNASRFFLNGADKEHFTMDVVNSIQFEIIRNIKLSVNTSLEYDYNVSDKLQFSQMVLIGFLYEIQPKVM